MLRDEPKVNALNPRPKFEAGLKAEKSFHAKHASKAVKNSNWIVLLSELYLKP